MVRVKVRELIEQLSKINPEAVVLTVDCCYGPSVAEVLNMEAILMDEHGAVDRVDSVIDDWDGEWYVSTPGPIVQAVVIE